jgi:esterase/lipase superfamily enzyme
VPSVVCFLYYLFLVVVFAWARGVIFVFYWGVMVSGLGSAPQLARLVGLLSQHTQARHIDVLSYSAGGTVASDGLALVGRAAADTGRDPKLGEVHHAAPDADFRGFVDDLRDYAGTADRVTVSLNMADSALRLSEVINRASRAGRPDLRELSPGDLRFLQLANRELGLEIVQVRGQDLPGMSHRSHGFWYMDPWVSSDVIIKLLSGRDAAARGLVQADGPEGLTVWRFPTDYDARLPGVLAAKGGAFATGGQGAALDPAPDQARGRQGA